MIKRVLQNYEDPDWDAIDELGISADDAAAFEKEEQQKKKPTVNGIRNKAAADQLAKLRALG